MSLPLKTILIVDDTPNILQLLFNYLDRAGYKILIAQNGQKALKVAQTMQPDLIVLDVMMPELDGFTTCNYLKANPITQNIPIIFMTALSQTEDKVKGFKLGAVDYITKPIEEQELLARIQTHLTLQSLNRRLAKDVAQQKLLGEISDRIRQSLDLNLILQTATEELKNFLQCDFVGLAQLNGKNISLTAYSTNGDTNSRDQSTILQDYLCSHIREEEYADCTNYDFKNQLCHQLVLQKNIQVVDLQTAETFLQDTDSALDFPRKLVVPILINSIKTLKNITQSQFKPLLEETVLPQSLAKNTLWGWLIVERSPISPNWESGDINILKKLGTQLAIAIKQGLLYQQLSQLALLDSLTHLYNRRYFDRQLNLEWRRLTRTSSPLSLIICDVDCFKIYNDTYGHQQGDKCLQAVAQAITSALKRPADILARYGGEEFTIILPQTPKAGAIKVAETVRSEVKKLGIAHQNSTVNSVVTISLGVAHTIPNLEDNPHLLVEAADQALYQAKENGRDCVSVYSEPITHSKNKQDKQKTENSWVKRLRQALEHNSFSLYAQIIAPLNTDDDHKHFEILLRLTDETEQVITPNYFLDIAERNFMMPEIDTWVINNLLEQLGCMDSSHWQTHRFSINLSGASLNSEPFLEFLLQKIKTSDLPPELFCFEITESVAVADFDTVSEFIKLLKNIGCSFALDDFGKGMSSLTYLKNLSVDYLKIDGSFVSDLNNNQAAKVMVEAINHIALGIGLKTVAEFVENQSILETIRNLKVDYAQGFHLGRPGMLMEVIT